MRLDVHHHFDAPLEVRVDAPGVEVLDQKLDRIINRLGRMEAKMSNMQDELNALRAAVEAQTTVQGGVTTLIQRAIERIDALGAQISAAADDPTEVRDLAAQLRENTAALAQGAESLAAAVEAGTESPIPPDLGSVVVDSPAEPAEIVVDEVPPAPAEPASPVPAEPATTEGDTIGV